MQISKQLTASRCGDPEDPMAYQYPYLNPNQTRTREPTAWEQELANAMEGVFAKGARELDEVIEGLNASRVRPPNGGDWTAENFTTVMRKLGA
jgi:recombinase-like protein